MVALSGKLPQPGRGGPGIEPLDEADGVHQPGLLDEQALEQVDARVEVLVDVVTTALDGGALLDDLARRAAMASSSPAVICRSATIVETR